MQGIREVIDANRLMSIITLPEALRGRKLEVIIFPADAETQPKLKIENVDEIVDSLIGVISDSGITLSEYRAERLAKYEVVD